MDATTPYDPYKDPDRLIFRYHNGTKIVAVDPIAINRDMNVSDDYSHDDIDIAQVRNKANDPDVAKEAAEAQRRIIGMVRRVFKITPLNDGATEGLTDTECLKVYVDFATYVGGLAEKALPLPSSSPPTDGPAADGPPTPSSSDSGITDTEPSTDELPK